MDNLKLAHKRAREDKSYYKEVKMVDKNPDYYFKQIEEMLVNKTYNMTPDDYKMMVKNDRGKERNLYVLDYFPHRIIQHALLIQIEDVIFRNLIETTYSSLPTRGIHKALNKLTYDLRNDVENTQFCLQMDIKKFYPSINHEINKQQYRKMFKDDDLLWLIDTIVDSLCLDDDGLKVELDGLLSELELAEYRKGIAIGSVFSQWDGNFNLSEFDHWIKEEKRVKYYYRYCDDLVILAKTKEELHEIRKDIQIYLKEKLKLDLKGNYKVYPVDIQGIDFVGYRHFRTYILLRKSTSKRLIRRMRDMQNKIDNGGEFDYSDYCSINGYMGWIQWCNGHNLYVKWIEPLMPHYHEYYETKIKSKKRIMQGEIALRKFSDFATESSIMSGDKIKIGDITGKEVEVIGYTVGNSKFEGKKLLTLQIKLDGENRVVFTSSNVLIDQSQKYEEEMPFLATIKKINNRFYSFT